MYLCCGRRPKKTSKRKRKIAEGNSENTSADRRLGSSSSNWEKSRLNSDDETKQNARKNRSAPGKKCSGDATVQPTKVDDVSVVKSSCDVLPGSGQSENPEEHFLRDADDAETGKILSVQETISTTTDALNRDLDFVLEMMTRMASYDGSYKKSSSSEQQADLEILTKEDRQDKHEGELQLMSELDGRTAEDARTGCGSVGDSDPGKGVPPVNNLRCDNRTPPTEDSPADRCGTGTASQADKEVNGCERLAPPNSVPPSSVLSTANSEGQNHFDELEIMTETKAGGSGTGGGTGGNDGAGDYDKADGIPGDLPIENPGDVSPTPEVVDQFKLLRLDVLKATSKLLDFVSEIWKKQENLLERLANINLFCLILKMNLHKLENFGLRLALMLSSVKEKKSLEKKLFSQIKLVQNIRDGINRYLESLETENLNTESGGDAAASDAAAAADGDDLKIKVGNIILLTRVIPGLVRAFGSLVDEMFNSAAAESSPEVMPKVEGALPPSCGGGGGSGNARTTAEFENRLSSENTAPQLSHGGLSVLQVEAEGNTPRFAEDPPASSDSDPPASSGSVTFLPTSETINEFCESVVRRRRPKPLEQSCNVNDDALENRFSASELNTPDIRGSGISLTVQTKLEELQQAARDQSVTLHTDTDCSFMDYDIPAGIMEENLPHLCESDRKLLLFYSDQMFSHWNVLDDAAAAFFRSMENLQPPKVFVMHGKFVIVAGHKMVYVGDVLARNLADADAKQWLLEYSNDLCNRLKLAVRKTKEAALSFPSVLPQQLMVDAIKDVTDSGYELKELLFRLAYLGWAVLQTFTW